MDKWIVILALFTAVASASEIHSFPTTDSQKSIALAKEYLTPKGVRGDWKLEELKNLKPTGPVFMDQALEAILSNESKWKTYSEPRERLMEVVYQAIQNSLPWKDFKGSSLEHSIHQKAQQLLAKFPKSGGYQSLPLGLYALLDLWSESDLPFLITKIYGDNAHAKPYWKTILKLFDKASQADKQLIKKRAQAMQKRRLMHYVLFYKTGLMEEPDLVWLLRMYMENSFSPFAGSDTDFLAYNAERDPEREALISKTKEDVLRDLHQRLRENDPLVLSAYNTVREKIGWPGKHMGLEERKDAAQFLKDLYSGAVFLDCNLTLREVPKEEE